MFLANFFYSMDRSYNICNLNFLQEKCHYLKKRTRHSRILVLGVETIFRIDKIKLIFERKPPKSSIYTPKTHSPFLKHLYKNNKNELALHLTFRTFSVWLLMVLINKYTHSSHIINKIVKISSLLNSRIKFN